MTPQKYFLTIFVISLLTYAIISLVCILFSKIELMRNEIEQIRNSTFPRANLALNSNGAEIESVFDMEMDFKMCFIKAITGNLCDYSNSPRHLIRVR